MDSSGFDDENGDLRDRENDETHDVTQEHSSSDIDTDEERRRFLVQSIIIDIKLMNKIRDNCIVFLIDFLWC